MLFLGEHYDAQALLELGVAWRVVPDERLLAEAQSVAEKLSGLPPLAIRAMKRVLNQGVARDITTALRLETEATVVSFLDPETTRRLKDF
jgi:enoyl-CoA hydratase/carnithine racemase